MTRTLQRLGIESLVSDGGMGSLLQTAVVRARCPEEANLIAPEQVVALHVAFIHTNSNLILTNTYNANSAKLTPHKLDDHFETINQTNVKLTRETREVA